LRAVARARVERVVARERDERAAGRLREEDELVRARAVVELFLLVVAAFRLRVPALLRDEELVPLLRTAWVKLLRAFLKCV
jgi:hypothetical protein